MTLSERFAADFGFMLIALVIAALLGFILGWIFRGVRIAALQTEIDDLKRRLKDCENSKKKTAPVIQKAVSKPVSNTSNFDASAAKATFGKKIKENDLKIVEGIGPKIEGIFNDGGIKTWAQLAATSASKLKSLLDAAGPRYQMHNPTTWPKQADMANKGKWSELKTYQDKLDGGKE